MLSFTIAFLLFCFFLFVFHCTFIPVTFKHSAFAPAYCTITTSHCIPFRVIIPVHGAPHQHPPHTFSIPHSHQLHLHDWGQSSFFSWRRWWVPLVSIPTTPMLSINSPLPTISVFLFLFWWIYNSYYPCSYLRCPYSSTFDILISLLLLFFTSFIIFDFNTYISFGIFIFIVTSFIAVTPMIFSVLHSKPSIFLNLNNTRWKTLLSV